VPVNDTDILRREVNTEEVVCEAICDPGMQRAPASSLQVSARRASHGEGKAQTPVSKPKRPLTAYNFFFRDQKERIADFRRQNQGRACPPSATMVSELWKKITPDLRAHYDVMAAKEKFRHYEEKLQWEHYTESHRDDNSQDTSGDQLSTRNGGANEDEPSAEDFPLRMDLIPQLAEKLGSSGVNFLIQAFK
jgi:hypothetical protein